VCTAGGETEAAAEVAQPEEPVPQSAEPGETQQPAAGKQALLYHFVL